MMAEPSGTEDGMELPKFKYHPDPVSTGSIVESEAKCVCCGEVRGYVYSVTIYGDENYDHCICPWCIADGSAHKKLGITFMNEDAVGGDVDWDRVPESVVEEITQRTPAFTGWQPEQWLTHCGDAAQFLGLAGRKELEAFGPDPVAGIKENSDLEDAEWDDVYAALSKDGSPTAYLFRCSKCGEFGGFWDCD